MSANQFERKLRERMRQAEITPRPEVWEQVASRIEPNDRRRGFFWLFFDWALGISLVLLFLLPFQSTELSTAIAASRTPDEIQANSPRSNSESIVPAPQPAVEAISPASSSLSQISQAPPVQSGSTQTHSTTRQTAVLHQAVSPPPSLQTQTQAPQTAPATQFPQAGITRSASSTQHSLLSMTSNPGLQETKGARLQPAILPEAGNLSPETEPNSYLADAAAAEQSIKLNPIDPHTQISIGTSLPPFTAAPIPWELKSRNKWAFRFFVRPERSTAIAFGLSEANDFSPVINNSRTSESNVVYGNYQPPNDETYYVVSHPQNSFTVGAHAEYFINRRLSVQSGISITSFELGTYEEGVVYSTDQISAGVGTPVSLDSVIALGLTEDLNFDAASGSSYRSLMIAVPVQVNYYLTRGRSSWILSGGISLTQEYTDGTSSQPNALDGSPLANTQISSFSARSLHSYVTAKVLYERAISPKLGLYAGPGFQYRLNAGNAAEGIPGTSPLRHRLGLEMGIRFSAGK